LVMKLTVLMTWKAKLRISSTRTKAPHHPYPPVGVLSVQTWPQAG
jgi:hypothetical protein